MMSSESEPAGFQTGAYTAPTHGQAFKPEDFVNRSY